jgi:hypothetical protein
LKKCNKLSFEVPDEEVIALAADSGERELVYRSRSTFGKNLHHRVLMDQRRRRLSTGS